MKKLPFNKKDCSSAFSDRFAGFLCEVQSDLFSTRNKKTARLCIFLQKRAVNPLVEVTGLEPTTSWSRTKRATKLRYTSINSLVIIQQIAIKIN